MKKSGIIYLSMAVLSVLLILLIYFRFYFKPKEEFQLKPVVVGSTTERLKSEEYVVHLQHMPSTMPQPQLLINPFDGRTSDQSGNNHMVSLEGGTKIDNGKIVLTGNNSFINTNFRPNLDNNVEYTFMMWFRDDAPGTTSAINNDNNTMTSLISNFGPLFTWEFTGLHIDNQGRIHISERNHLRQIKSASTSRSFTDGKWHLLTKVATSRSQILYIGGEKMLETERVGGRVTSRTNNIVIGGGRMGRFQTAEVGPVQIFIGTALNQRQVQYVFQTQSVYRRAPHVDIVPLTLHADMIVVNGKSHAPLQSHSINNYKANEDYIVIDSENPDPANFASLDNRISRLRSHMWDDQNWQYYIILVSRRTTLFYHVDIPEDGLYFFNVRMYSWRRGRQRNFDILIKDPEEEDNDDDPFSDEEEEEEEEENELDGERTVDGKRLVKQAIHVRNNTIWNWYTYRLQLKKGVNKIGLKNRIPTPISALQIVNA